MSKEEQQNQPQSAKATDEMEVAGRQQQPKPISPRPTPPMELDDVWRELGTKGTRPSAPTEHSHADDLSPTQIAGLPPKGRSHSV